MDESPQQISDKVLNGFHRVLLPEQVEDGCQ